MINLLAIIILLLFPIETHCLMYRLPDGYHPKNGTQLSIRANWLTTTQVVDSRISKQVERIISEAQSDGLCLVVSSGYRSFQDQVRVYDQAKDKSLVMKPGWSEHQTGLAVDFQACPMRMQLGGPVRDDSVERPELAGGFETLPEYQWLKENAKKYGIDQSYSYEPWHWKFTVPVPQVSYNLGVGSNMPEVK